MCWSSPITEPVLAYESTVSSFDVSLYSVFLVTEREDYERAMIAMRASRTW